jgi:hypothetical protein
MLKKPAIGQSCNGCGLCCQITMCSIASFALSRVENWGDRAPGPCPAVTKSEGKLVCGLILRPTDWLPKNKNSVTAIRDSMKLCIGSGFGCDEAGEEPAATAQPALDEIRARFAARYSQADILKAVATVLDQSRSLQ